MSCIGARVYTCSHKNVKHRQRYHIYRRTRVFNNKMCRFLIVRVCVHNSTKVIVDPRSTKTKTRKLIAAISLVSCLIYLVVCYLVLHCVVCSHAALNVSVWCRHCRRLATSSRLPSLFLLLPPPTAVLLLLLLPG